MVPLVLICRDPRTEFLVIAIMDSLVQPLDALHTRLVHSHSLAASLPEAVHPFVLAELLSQSICFCLEMFLLLLELVLPAHQLVARRREHGAGPHLERSQTHREEVE